MIKKYIYSVSFMLLFSGCVQNVPTHDEATVGIEDSNQSIKIPAHYTKASNRHNVANTWIRTFHDSRLNHLVKEAQKNNLNLKVAQSRVARATAITKYTEAGLKPSIGVRGYYRDNNAEGSNEISFGGFGVSWEPDLWGRVANSVSRDKELTSATLLDYQFARQSLAANTAKAWFLLSNKIPVISFL